VLEAAPQATEGHLPRPVRTRTGALDPRLLHYARSTRYFVVLAAVVGGATAALLIAQAWLIATVVAGAFLQHRSLGSLRTQLVALLCVVLGRAVLAWAAERAAFRASASAKSELRHAVVARVAEATGGGSSSASDSGSGRGLSTGSLSLLVTTGLDALDGYFSRYLPQLLLAVIVPVAVIGVVAGADWVSAVLIAVSIPLIPLFMALVGATTKERTAARMRSLQRLGGHFLDVVAGLPTLKVFGRAKAQARSIADVTNRYRSATLATLRLTFLSSLVLELLATVSVALVAVAVGLRLLGGNLSLHALGAQYHASADGMKAAEQLFAYLEDAPGATEARGTGTTVPRDDGIRVSGLEVTYPGRRLPALHDVDLTVEPGETVALVGPSGCGKSTLLAVLLGLQTPSAGVVRCGGVALDGLDVAAWRARIGWVPQRPHLFARTVAENVRLGRPDATDDQVSAALDAAGLAEVVRRLPAGVSTRLGEGGSGLSAGERQRLALARAFVREASLLLLDEPTAGLDNETEAEVLAAVRRLTEGRTALLVAHRPALVALADRVVELPPALVPA